MQVFDYTVTLLLEDKITTSDFLYLDYTATDTCNYLTGQSGVIDNFTNFKIDIYVEPVEIKQTIVPNTTPIHAVSNLITGDTGIVDNFTDFLLNSFKHKCFDL